MLDWLCHEMPADTLVGMDLGISLPFADKGAFFPGWAESPPNARKLWALVDRLCAADPHLSVGTFVDHPHIAPHFRRHGGREGTAFGGGRGRLRLTEYEQARNGCKPTSNFNLVGAAQVGKSSLSGMRLLHRLNGCLPVWPIDPLPPSGSVVTEIYTAIAAISAGRPASRSKIRDHAELCRALSALDSQGTGGHGPIDDHSSDAILTAAWLRRDGERSDLWHPAGLSDEIARTEGWTFGVP